MRRWVVIVMFLAGVAVLIWIAATVSNRAKGDLGKKRRLPDGSTLVLREVVVTATNFTFSYQEGSKFLRLVRPILPAAIRNKFSTSSGSLGYSGLEGDTNIILVTVHRSDEKKWVSTVHRLRLFDDEGNTYDAARGASTLVMGGATVHCWRIHSFPRRGRMLSLRFMALHGGTWTNAADFRIPNPLYAEYPQWIPEPWPANRHDGDLTATLKQFHAGARMSDRMGQGDALTAARKTRVVFAFAENGKESEDWRVQKLTISDATGNRWSPYLDFVQQDSNWTTNGTVEFFGALWRGENAWKLNAEIVRAGGFEPNQLWEVAIALPPPGIVNTLTNAWEHDGMSVKLVSVGSPETDHAGDHKWVAKWWGAEKSKVYSLALSVDPEPKGSRLSAIRCVDQNGREIKIVQHGSQDSGKQAIFFKPASDATEARLTLASQRSRFVEFLARPEFVE